MAGCFQIKVFDFSFDVDIMSISVGASAFFFSFSKVRSDAAGIMMAICFGASVFLFSLSRLKAKTKADADDEGEQDFTTTTLPMKSAHAPTTFKTIVLLGDVGMGKSTIVEKVTGMTGLSSNAHESFTRSSEAFLTECGRLQLVDCPGSNAMADKLEHNVWIAHALNMDPVSIILLVVKAETRIDNTVGQVRNYAERFLDFSEMLGVCVTHMDLVSWDQRTFLKHINDELGIASAMFVSKSSSGQSIKDEMLKHCTKQWDLSITSDNFLKYFKIHDSNFKILQGVRAEVTRFSNMNRDFMLQLEAQSNSNVKKDMVFEFQEFMEVEITKATERVSGANSFSFCGSGAPNEVGHIANMRSQLKAVLHDVRVVAAGFQADAGVSTLRKCPHCGIVWAKLAGCDGGTTCGNLMGIPDSRTSSMATFAFIYDEVSERLTVQKTGERQVGQQARTDGQLAGCGKSIVWSQMAPVELPPEFHAHAAASVSTDDISELPKIAKRVFHDVFSKVYKKKNRRVKRTRL